MTKNKRSLANLKKWREENPERVKEHNIRRGQESLKKYHETRKKAMEYLGNKCSICYCYNEDFLHIDHINSDGAIERRTRGKGGVIGILREILGDKRPDLRILCGRCNERAKFNGGDSSKWPEYILKQIEDEKEFYIKWKSLYQ